MGLEDLGDHGHGQCKHSELSSEIEGKCPDFRKTELVCLGFLDFHCFSDELRAIPGNCKPELCSALAPGGTTL
jgi:hypothetical protein